MSDADEEPPHPGQIVKHDVIEPLGLSVTAAAIVLDVSRKTLSEMVNERAGVSAEMAVRLEKAFGSTARLWLDLQMAYDLAQVQLDSIKVAKNKASDVATLHPTCNTDANKRTAPND